ncbi:MAG: ArnT family glycosyltransferase [Acidimicrobiia bacterium]
MQKAGGEVTEGGATPDAPRWEAIGTVVTSLTVVGVSLYRVITLGFLGIAPDDATYIGVGRALWRLREPLGVNGDLFTVRSWAYPLMVGAASHLSSDPFRGPRVLGWTLATTALVLAIVFAFRVARGVGAVATGLAILAAPVLWTTVSSTRVEVALILSMMLVLLVVDTPTPRRMLIGGILAGVTLLIKETSAPLVILPFAYLGTIPRDAWRRLALRFWIGFFVAVAWWFVTVLVIAGEIFPLQGIRQAAKRNVPRGFTLNLSAWLLIALCIAAWLIVAIGRRRDPRARILVLAGLAFLPASVIAWQSGFALRQFVPIALLSCIAIGVAAAELLAAALRRSRRGGTRAVVAAAVVIGLVAVVPIAFTQDRTNVAGSTGGLDAKLASWVAARPGEPTVLSSFRFKVQFWARVEGGDATVRGLPSAQTSRRPALPATLWIDASSRDYRSIPRENMAHQLHGVDYLVLTGPHRYGPIALAIWLEQHGRDVGLVPVAHFGPASLTSWAYVYKVDHPRLDEIPTIVTADAVTRMDGEGGFEPVGPTVIAGTRAWLQRYALTHPTDGTHPYEPMRSPAR